MDQTAQRPELSTRFRVLAQDGQWRHHLRVLDARWSATAVLLATDESMQILKDLAAQAEELSAVSVGFSARRPAIDHGDDELEKRHVLWNRAFANSAALEETLIDLGGERRVGGQRFRTPGQRLLPPTLAALQARDRLPMPSIAIATHSQDSGHHPR